MNANIELGTSFNHRRPSKYDTPVLEYVESPFDSTPPKRGPNEPFHAVHSTFRRLSPGHNRPSSPRSISMIFRPRILFVLLTLALSSLLLLSTEHRSNAHAALTRAGIPLPSKIPDLGIRKGLAGWSSRWSSVAETSENRFTLDDEPYQAGEKNDVFEDVGAIVHPDDPLADAPIGAPVEHVGHSRYEDELGPQQEQITFGDNPVFHPSNGYFILPDHDQLAAHPLPRHPILDLMDKAEREWNAKVEKQSKTLDDAVREYRRRYKRRPPLGFDKWFEYAQAHNVVLTDEYDQIFKDLQPFWALPPEDLTHRVEEMHRREMTFTIHIEPGSSPIISYSGEEADLKRAHDLGAVIDLFAKDLPLPLSLTFTKHDQPACQLGWGHRDKMNELAGMGEYFGPSEFVETEDPMLTNWANGCAPTSPLRKSELGDLTTSHVSHPEQLSTHRSFVYDHAAAMDVCQHPEAMALHGYTAALGTNLGELVPLFTFAKTVVHSDILATPLEQYSDTYIGFQPEWKDKLYNELLWRGSTTGVEFRANVDWQLSQRARLHFMTHETEGTRSILYAGADGVPIEAEYPTRVLNEAYMNTAFAGQPVQCDAETCDLMNEIIDFENLMGLDESYEYKYLIDVDGNGWSGRFHRLMSTRSCVIKTTIFPEWYADRVQPWLHYIPLKVDYSDLYDIMAFFIGTPDGKNGHDDMGYKVAEAGRIWALEHGGYGGLYVQAMSRMGETLGSLYY